jgi:hypothetical protein
LGGWVIVLWGISTGAIGMKLEELKAKVEKDREHFAKREPKPLMTGPNGPTGLHLIDAIVAVLEDQQRQIDELKSQRG